MIIDSRAEDIVYTKLFTGVHGNYLKGPAARPLCAALKGIHGAAHWARVRWNGRALAERTGANRTVVEIFALVHDVCRHNDDHDPEHGVGAAEFVSLHTGCEGPAAARGGLRAQRTGAGVGSGRRALTGRECAANDDGRTASHR